MTWGFQSSVGNAIPFTWTGPGDFLKDNPLYDADIELQFKEIMKDAQNQRLYQDLLKDRKSYYLKRRLKQMQDELAKRQKEDRLASQLPHIVVSGFKKCGTKTLQHFFGFHPEIVSGRSENPVQITGDAKNDLDAYLFQAYQNWKWVSHNFYCLHHETFNFKNLI